MGVGEGSLLVAEQFAFQQRFGDRGAVDRDERLVAAAAEIVDRLADDFLAGAVFAKNQDRQLGVGHAANRRAQGFDRRAVADQLHALGGLLDDVTVPRQQLLELLRVLQGNRGVRGQLDQSPFVVRRKIAGQLVDHFEGAEQLAVAAAQRHAQQSARLIAQVPIDLAIDLCLLGGIDAAWLAAMDNLADHARVVGNSQFAPFDSQGRPADQRVVRAVPEKDAGSIGLQQLRGRLGHLHQQRLHFVGLVPLAGNRQDGFQPLDAPPLLLASAGRIQRGA